MKRNEERDDEYSEMQKFMKQITQTLTVTQTLTHHQNFHLYMLYATQAIVIMTTLRERITNTQVEPPILQHHDVSNYHPTSPIMMD